MKKYTKELEKWKQDRIALYTKMCNHAWYLNETEMQEIIKTVEARLNRLEWKKALKRLQEPI